MLSFLKNKYPSLYFIYKFGELYIERMNRNHLFMLGSAIAFNILLYQIPLLFLTLYFVNMGGLLKTFEKNVIELIYEFYPPTSDTEDYITMLINEVDKVIDYSSFFGIIGLATLLWLSSHLISGIRYSLNTIFKIRMDNYFIVYKLRDMLVVIVLSILVLIYTFIMPILGVVQDFIVNIFPDWLNEAVFISEVLITITTLITGFAFFYLVYKFVPTDSIPRKLRLMSTILSVIIIEVTRHIFAWYLVGVSSYGKFYGGFTLIVSIALWIYYSSMIILLSAEFSKLWYDIKDNRKLVR